MKKEEEEGPLRTDRTWREGVLWYLGRGLEGAGEVHRGMMEKRYEREVERSRSVLYMSQGAKTGRVSMPEASTTNGTMPDTATAAPPASRSRNGAANAADPMGMEEEREIERQLSPDQLQLFARENQDLLKQYEDTLDQVR